MNDSLRHALNIARERLDGDSDAYADEDIIARLVAAIDEGVPVSIRADLAATARQAASSAQRASGPVEAREWAEAAKVALEGWALAPADDAILMPDDERRVAAAQVVELREDVERQATARRQLMDFVEELASTFEASGSETSTRIAARMRGALEDAATL